MIAFITLSIVLGFTLVTAPGMNFGHRSKYHQNPLCRRGWHGRACDKQCTEDFHCIGRCQHCISARCTSAGTCQRICAPEWWNQCEERCSPGCVSGACNDNDGTCLYGCMPGLYGPSCSKHCSVFCSGTICRRNGVCDCKPGYSGITCNVTCPSNCISCSHSDNMCTSCKQGYHGINCDTQCQEGCLNRSCRQNGSCSCIDGYHGVTCSKSCPQKCKTPANGNSKDRICDIAGRCLLGCRAGWFGKRCNRRCDKGCSNRLCRQESGNCLMCISGHFGSRCNFSCAYSMHNTCDRRDGSCLHGCQKGFFGKKCNNDCPRCLHKNCTDSSPTGPQCMTGCVDGWWGPGCERPCSGQCITCEWKTGACISCDGNHTGQSCTDPCSHGCLEGKCSRKGDCTAGCRDGFYGTNCSLRCGAQCRACRREDGSCWNQHHGYGNSKVAGSSGGMSVAMVTMYVVVLVLLSVGTCALVSSFRWKTRLPRRRKRRGREAHRIRAVRPPEAVETMCDEEEHTYEEINVYTTTSL